MNISFRAACLSLAVVALAPAQFRDLATTADGSRLYFLSSLRQRRTAQPLFSKIYSLDARGVSLVWEFTPPGPNPYDQYSVGPLQAAGDGSWVTYGRLRNCIGGSSCFLNEQRSASLVTGGATEGLGPNARFSRDGRWLVVYSSPNVLMRYSRRIDRRDGSWVDLPKPSTAPAVALDGTVLIPSYDRLVLWKDGATRELAPGVEMAVMDDAATTAVYQTRTERHLRVVDIASGRIWPLGPDTRDNWAPNLSSDGQHVLYLSRIGKTPQVFFSRRDGTEWKQLTALDSGAREAVLSGDGRTAWVATGDGAILRIDTGTGAAEQRIAPIPQVDSPLNGAIGSVVSLVGSGFAGVESVKIAGRAVPLDAVYPDQIYFQTPWDLTEATDSEIAFDAGDPAFDAAFPFNVRSQWPVASGVVIHEDFGSLVTESSPARPGEVLHLYVMGLGPVAPRVATGQPAPSDPLSRTLLPFEWTWSVGGETIAEVLYSGLAPTLTGWYQVDVRVPVAVDNSSIWLAVRLNQAGAWASWGLGYIPVQR
ncbi:MAG TPA: hypothetical protein VN442_22725 [Bryobacteraceae bacterium]|nr:hypothetical protein [Bryobacteraceae bacterium]